VQLQGTETTPLKSAQLSFVAFNIFYRPKGCRGLVVWCDIHRYVGCPWIAIVFIGFAKSSFFSGGFLSGWGLPAPSLPHTRPFPRPSRPGPGDRLKPEPKIASVVFENFLRMIYVVDLLQFFSIRQVGGKGDEKRYGRVSNF